MNLKRALETEGWMTTRELMYLASVAAYKNRAVEVGSWQGRSTLAIAENMRGLAESYGSMHRVMAVDTWQGSPEHKQMLAEKGGDWLLSQFIKNIDGIENVDVYVGTSLEAAALLAKYKMTCDLIFLDASHDYDSVKADILAWTPLLAEGGILCGHDYDPPNWMGVKQAVDECVPKFRVVPNTTIWTTEGAQ
jgi:predicted O-methyltransferase YrrM